MFGTVKQFLGIGGVTVTLEIPAAIEKERGEIMGMVRLTTKSDQHVTRVTVMLVEEVGDEQKRREIELGCVCFDQPFDMVNGEAKAIAFKLPFQYVQPSLYFVKAEADVQGTFLAAVDKKGIRLV
jgi:hypothetical protein